MKARSNTCIAVVEDTDGLLVMAADRRISFEGGAYQKAPVSKINKRNGVILGGSGHGFICSLLVDQMPIPEINEDNTVDYMFNTFIGQVIVYLRNLGVVHPTELRLIDSMSNPNHVYETGILIVLDSRVYGLSLSKECISLDMLSAPYAVGCGGDYALGSILTTAKYKMSVNKRLTVALQVAASLSSGCDTNIDIIKEGDDE